MSNAQANQISTGTTPGSRTKIDINKIRSDFPVLSEQVNGVPLVYLDSAASNQMPLPVIERVNHYHRHEHANVHRGIHTLSTRATGAMEDAREKVKEFINARFREEIIWTYGTTDAINLVAHTLGRIYLHEGDEIILTEMEHHANIVPWQIIAEQVGAVIRVIPMDDRGVLRFDQFTKMIGPKTRLLAITHISNVLGTVNPVGKYIEVAHRHDIPVLVDGAQSAPHMGIDVQNLDCDFFAFSGHKMYGPTGVGVLYGKRQWLDRMPPYRGGGEMIDRVTFKKTTYNELPFKFEAGTPPIAGAIGMGAAIDYIRDIGPGAMQQYEHDLLDYATEQLQRINDLRIIGTAPDKASIISFLLKDIHPHDIGTLLDQQGIAIRTGHHCAQPLMDRLDIPATARASFSVFNTREEVDKLVDGIKMVKRIFA